MSAGIQAPERRLCRPCPSCDSRVFARVTRAGQFDFRELVLLAHQDVIELLLDGESAVVADPARFAEDQFDVVLV